LPYPWLGANDAPQIRHDDDALWKRIHRLPFLHQLAKDAIDRDLPDELADPARSGTALLGWLLDGARRWYVEGLGTAEAAEHDKQAYREAMNPFTDFFADRVTFAPHQQASSAALWEAYTYWLARNATSQKGSRRGLATALRGRGCTQATDGDTRGWQGVGLLHLGRTDDPQLAE
jgi:putative DNA primase/helicase